MFKFLKKKPTVDEVEFSVNIQLADVGPFLERVARRIESGFKAADVAKIISSARALRSGEATGGDYPISYDGRETVLKLGIVSDDALTVDLVLVTNASLNIEIEKEFDLFIGERET